MTETEPCSPSRTCAVEFPTPDGVVHAVDGISYTLARVGHARDRR